MTQDAAEDVQFILDEYHETIFEIVQQAYDDWLALKRQNGPMRYPRTRATIIFDNIQKYAKRAFDGTAGVVFFEETQTFRVLFKNQVLLRFKLGDEKNLGRNVMTQSVLKFVEADAVLPGIPPQANKVEVLYSINEIDTELAEVLIAARDGKECLWHYHIFQNGNDESVLELPTAGPSDHDEPNVGETVVKLREFPLKKVDE